MENELQGALVPQEDDGRLGATGHDKVGLPVYLDKLGICVAEPLVEVLVGEETSFVALRLVCPLVQSGQASLGAVHDHKVPVSVHVEDLNVVWLWDVDDLDRLELDEFVLLIVELVNMGASKELGDNDQDVVIDQDRPASNNRLPCWGYNIGIVLKHKQISGQVYFCFCFGNTSGWQHATATGLLHLLCCPISWSSFQCDPTPWSHSCWSSGQPSPQRCPLWRWICLPTSTEWEWTGDAQSLRDAHKKHSLLDKCWCYVSLCFVETIHSAKCFIQALCKITILIFVLLYLTW